VSAAELASTPRILHLWFSHPLFDRESHIDVMFVDGAGNLLTPSRSIVQSIHTAEMLGGKLGWLAYTISPNDNKLFNPLIREVTVRLNYTVGPWENQQQVPADFKGTMTLEDGGQLSSIGQDAKGRTFVVRSYGTKSSERRQFGVVAFGKDGRELESQGSSMGGQWNVDSKLLVERLYFNVPLADIAYFRIGTRPVRTMELINVVLPKN
jgi:hypothetical protein